MELLIGFFIGLFYGCFLWWQTLKQEDDLYRDYQRLSRELMATRAELLAKDRNKAHGWAGHTAQQQQPSRN